MQATKVLASCEVATKKKKKIYKNKTLHAFCVANISLVSSFLDGFKLVQCTCKLLDQNERWYQSLSYNKGNLEFPSLLNLRLVKCMSKFRNNGNELIFIVAM